MHHRARLVCAFRGGNQKQESGDPAPVTRLPGNEAEWPGPPIPRVHRSETPGGPASRPGSWIPGPRRTSPVPAATGTQAALQPTSLTWCWLGSPRQGAASPPVCTQDDLRSAH